MKNWAFSSFYFFGRPSHFQDASTIIDTGYMITSIYMEKDKPSSLPHMIQKK